MSAEAYDTSAQMELDVPMTMCWTAINRAEEPESADQATGTRRNVTDKRRKRYRNRGQIPIYGPELTEEQIMSGDPGLIDVDNLFRLAKKYTNAEILEQVNAGRDETVLTQRTLRNRLTRTLTFIAERDGRSREDVKSELDRASQTYFLARGVPMTNRRAWQPRAPVQTHDEPDQIPVEALQNAMDVDSDADEDAYTSWTPQAIPKLKAQPISSASTIAFNPSAAHEGTFRTWHQEETMVQATDSMELDAADALLQLSTSGRAAIDTPEHRSSRVLNEMDQASITSNEVSVNEAAKVVQTAAEYSAKRRRRLNIEIYGPEVTNEEILQGDPDHIDMDNLLRLAKQYANKDIVEKVNAGRIEPVLTVSTLKNRLYDSLAVIAKRDGRSRDSLRAEIERARLDNDVYTKSSQLDARTARGRQVQGAKELEVLQENAEVQQLFVSLPTRFDEDHHAMDEAEEQTENDSEDLPHIGSSADAVNSDDDIFQGDPDLICMDVMLDFAGRYTTNEILERINAGRPRTVINLNTVKQRIYWAMDRIARRDGRRREDLKADLDRTRQETGVLLRSRESATQKIKANYAAKREATRPKPSGSRANGLTEEDLDAMEPLDALETSLGLALSP